MLTLILIFTSSELRSHWCPHANVPCTFSTWVGGRGRRRLGGGRTGVPGPSLVCPQIWLSGLSHCLRVCNLRPVHAAPARSLPGGLCVCLCPVHAEAGASRLVCPQACPSLPWPHPAFPPVRSATRLLCLPPRRSPVPPPPSPPSSAPATLASGLSLHRPGLDTDPPATPLAPSFLRAPFPAGVGSPSHSPSAFFPLSQYREMPPAGPRRCYWCTLPRMLGQCPDVGVRLGFVGCSLPAARTVLGSVAVACGVGVGPDREQSRSQPRLAPFLSSAPPSPPPPAAGSTFCSELAPARGARFPFSFHLQPGVSGLPPRADGLLVPCTPCGFLACDVALFRLQKPPVRPRTALGEASRPCVCASPGPACALLSCWHSLAGPHLNLGKSTI